MKQTKTPPGDSCQIRCPRLGQQIHFSYCRQENLGLPCFKTLDCWHIYFQVVEHLQAGERARLEAVGAQLDPLEQRT